MDPSLPFLIAEIERLSKSSIGPDGTFHSDKARRELLKISQQLCIALQTTGQLVEDFLFGTADNLLLKIGVDLGIFRTLVANNAPLSLQSLVDHTGAERALLERIMRGLASIHALSVTDEGLYGATKIARAFASTKGDSGARLFNDLVIPGMHPLPKFLATTGYKVPNDLSHLPFNLSFGPDNLFEWVAKHPEVLTSFQQWMTSQREGHTLWLEFYPFQQQIVEGYDKSDQDGVLIVDIGGNMGQELLELNAQFPSLPGRMVLQDLPTSIEKVVPSDKMEAMAYDFFETQPIKGARAYYLRNVLHDWNDIKCLAILRNIVDAIKPGYSKVLVNKFAITDHDPCAFLTKLDIIVIALKEVIKRTKK
ncbi:S-adenosyl-L-methionine-dependent methyltransferase [Corynespora cassiicola Philippines]|uniref:S-adenosyl-L-methionine-dependent methyltransferase n=1 Tax=Corynespora cassiicola Philippines TaxID=1448308 RepID=A0A2T2NHA1_CORCC|nr:S-adenosyl-L-methionine-dependent methyltransferase [Corynespora cassiicola Philippines]